MSEQVIVLTDLTKQYGNFTAVDHIRLNIRKGEIFGLLDSCEDFVGNGNIFL